MAQEIRLTGSVPFEYAGIRLDQALAQLFPDYSRSRLQQWIRAGGVVVDGMPLRAKDKVQGGERIDVQGRIDDDPRVIPQAIRLSVVYEDRSLLVLDKPAGLVVHPGAGNRDGTVQNALLNLDPRLAEVPRAGLVHRLDKDTSGLMVVARNVAAHKRLVEQLQARTVTREYLALVAGTFTGGGTVDRPVGRHPRDRKRQAVTEAGRPAVTHYRIEERFRAHTLLRVRLETGRTHQIRVHMAAIGHPLVGDPVYGGRMMLPKGATEPLRRALAGFRRQALHAWRLSLEHPETGERMRWQAPIPPDLGTLLDVMRRECPALTTPP